MSITGADFECLSNHWPKLDNAQRSVLAGVVGFESPHDLARVVTHYQRSSETVQKLFFDAFHAMIDTDKKSFPSLLVRWEKLSERMQLYVVLQATGGKYCRDTFVSTFYNTDAAVMEKLDLYISECEAALR